MGAGQDVVRVSSAVYEALTALVQRRRRRRLYHSALVVVTHHGRFVVEMTPIPDARGAERGVVAEGAVGTSWARRFRLFRYEIRRWPGGIIPDISFAVASPVRVAADPETARRILDLVPSVPTLVWGRDEAKAGDMWNSNSVTAWLLARAGVDGAAGDPPLGGRAPGWDAGLAVARRVVTGDRRRAAA